MIFGFPPFPTWKINGRIFLAFVWIIRLPDSEIDAMETLVKENHQLKQQLQTCFAKVAKTQKVAIPILSISQASRLTIEIPNIIIYPFL